MKVVNLFKTKTFWGIVLLFLSALIPKLREVISDHDISLDDLLALTGVLVGTGLSLLGRMDAHNKVAYTPHGLPGRDRSDAADQVINADH